VDPLEQAVLAWQSLFRGGREMGRPPLWFPWGVRALADLVIVALFAGFALPLVSIVMAPALRALAGERALHFPAALQQLPPVFARVSAGVNAVALPLLLAWSGNLLARRFRRETADASAAWGDVLRRLIIVIALVAPLVFALGVAGSATGDALSDLKQRPLRALIQLAIGMSVEIGLIALVAMVFPIAAVNEGPARQFAHDLRRAWRRSGVACIVLAIVFELVAISARMAGGMIEVRLTGERPELMPLAVVAGAVFAVTAQLLFCASSMVVYAVTVEDEAWRSC
jgi:hypothetical protein